MKNFFDSASIVTLYCAENEHGSVHLAVRDLASDLAKVSGRTPEVVRALPAAGADNAVVIGTLGSEGFDAFLASCGLDVSAIAGKEEHFALLPFAGGLVIAGSDRRGAMWGVYECCEKCLGVDPLYIWTDHEPKQVETLAIPQETIVDGPKTYRFRGWFINDEDLIEGFSKQAKPEKGYHFQNDYGTMLDMLIETALRLKQNMLIPCSHLDIMLPGDEEIVRRITERGLYVSMHHQEPVGVHQLRLDRYWAERGVTTENINFIDHPELYRKIWKEYIHRWAKYEGVIWQLGLRGRGDRPVWYQNDRVPDSTEARGALISDAIQMQMDIIKEECPDQEILSSATLWMEGMPLYRAGALHFPKGTMVIQSDFGPDQMWGEGYDETPRHEGTDYGVYYHLAFWGCGPHLIQGNRPEKIRHNFREALAKGDTCYCVLNVANFREFVYGVRYEAALTWDINSDDVGADRTSWCREQFEVEDTTAIEEVYKAYFKSFYPLDDTNYPAQMTFNDGMARRVAVKLMQIIRGSELIQEDIQNKRLYAFDDTDSFIAFYRKATEEGAARFTQTLHMAEAAREQIPAHRQAFFTANVIVQIEIMIGMYSWVNALCRAAQNRRAKASDEAFTALIDEAAAVLSKAVSDRQKALYGRFIHWYDGDRLMNLSENVRLTKTLYLAADSKDTSVANLSNMI